MEYVEGRTLREILHDSDRETPARGIGADATPAPLGVERAVEITAGVLSALEYSHHAGIVHRDIKPANVMLTAERRGQGDGLRHRPGDVADSSATMTQTQAVIGTAQYLSPEQARGETVDARSDLYSTGCLLFELLTGRPPFVGDSPVAVAYQHVREIPQAPSTFNPAVGADLDRIVLHALAKDRDDRYADAAEFRADLLAALDGRPVRAPVAVTARRGHGRDARGRRRGRSRRRRRLAAGDPGVQRARGRPRAGAGGPPRGRGRARGAPPRPRRRLRAARARRDRGVAGGIWLFTQVLDRPEDPVLVTVPDLTSSDRATAKAALEDEGLVYAEGEPQNSDTVAADLVMSQDPASGRQVEDGQHRHGGDLARRRRGRGARPSRA